MPAICPQIARISGKPMPALHAPPLRGRGGLGLRGREGKKLSFFALGWCEYAPNDARNYEPGPA